MSMDIIDPLETQHQLTLLKKYNRSVLAARITLYVNVALQVYGFFWLLSLDIPFEWTYNDPHITTVFGVLVTIGLIVLSYKKAFIAYLTATILFSWNLIYRVFFTGDSFAHFVVFTSLVFVLIIAWGLLFASDWERLRRELQEKNPD